MQKNILDNTFKFNRDHRQYSNTQLVDKALSILAQNLNNIQNVFQEENVQKESDTNMPNCYDITLNNQDYTLGKVLEYIYQTHYKKTISFVVSTTSPQINQSIIRIGFYKVGNPIIISYLVNAAKSAIDIFEGLHKYFSD